MGIRGEYLKKFVLDCPVSVPDECQTEDTDVETPDGLDSSYRRRTSLEKIHPLLRWNFVYADSLEVGQLGARFTRTP